MVTEKAISEREQGRGMPKGRVTQNKGGDSSHRLQPGLDPVQQSETN